MDARGERGAADETQARRGLGGDHAEVLSGQLVGQILEIGPASARRAKPPAQRSVPAEVQTEGGAKRRETPREVGDEEGPARSPASRRYHDRSRRAPPGRGESRRDQRSQHRWLARPRDGAARNSERAGERYLFVGKDNDTRKLRRQGRRLQ